MWEKIQRTLLFVWRTFCPLFIYMLAVTAADVLAEVSGIALGDSHAVIITGVGALVAAVPLGIAYRVARVQRHVFRNWNAAAFAQVVLLGIGSCIVLNDFITRTGLTSEAYEEAGRLLYQPSLAIQILFIGMAVPIGEELVFRGLGYFRMRWMLSFWPAALTSALFFGIFHGNIIQGMYAVGIGILLAWVHEVYGTLLAPIFLHMAANLSSIFLSRWDGMNFSDAYMTIMTAGVLMMIFALYRIRKDKKTYEVTFNRNSLL